LLLIFFFYKNFKHTFSNLKKLSQAAVLHQKSCKTMYVDVAVDQMERNCLVIFCWKAVKAPGVTLKLDSETSL